MRHGLAAGTPMHTTPASLLERLRQPNQQAAWARFVALYTPLLYHWARRVGLSSPQAGDLVQEVLLLLVRKLPEFVYDPRKSFRAWLRTVTLNKWRESLRRDPSRSEINGVDLSDQAGPDSIQELEDAEYHDYLARRALTLMQAEFQPTTWKACWEQVVHGRPAAEVARELGITEAAAHVAKSRVLRRLRQELHGLLD
jgi:RNA polymerase sigma-70 factor (ECF subfamily)